jgi:hypothetical protein
MQEIGVAMKRGVSYYHYDLGSLKRMAKKQDKDTSVEPVASNQEQDYEQSEEDVVDRPLVRTRTISLNRQKTMDPGLASWVDEVHPYEESFPKHDEHGRVLVATLEEIIQTVAQWYVRKNNKYYDVDVPGEVLSRDDVERVIIQRLKVTFSGNDIPQDVVCQILQMLIPDMFVSPRESIPIWSGVRKSSPGNPNKLMFSPHMTATINTWRVPAYRRLGENGQDWGPFEEFLEVMLPREEERDMIINWLAWGLQTEPPPTKVEGFSGLERLRRTVGSFPTEVGGFKLDFWKMKPISRGRPPSYTPQLRDLVRARWR